MQFVKFQQYSIIRFSKRHSMRKISVLSIISPRCENTLQTNEDSTVHVLYNVSPTGSKLRLCQRRSFKFTKQVRRSNFSKIVIFGVHNQCGVTFLMQKKKIRNLFSLRSYCKFPFLRDSLRHSSEVFLGLVSRLDFS